MIPLVVLLVVFLLMVLITWLNRKRVLWGVSGRIAMAVMMVFTASGHFMYTEGMSRMIPEAISWRKEVILITGVMEILLAIGLLIPRMQMIAAWLLILFFIAVLPANIYAAMHEIDYQNPDFTGPGVKYLWFRVPLQVLFILWTWWFGIRLSSRNV